ncbi:hypothetical protein Tcan_16877 [Toxocara canis]|uniref:Uncharacterized protein n=1 Tax=Toxocara canis TaxID=6265 RepID=A0A0B2V281_TOXCA|nr:hypothetical protein Tcan_16877 [Toxocara canis]
MEVFLYKSARRNCSSVAAVVVIWVNVRRIAPAIVRYRDFCLFNNGEVARLMFSKERFPLAGVNSSKMSWSGSLKRVDLSVAEIGTSKKLERNLERNLEGRGGGEAKGRRIDFLKKVFL